MKQYLVYGLFVLLFLPLFLNHHFIVHEIPAGCFTYPYGQCYQEHSIFLEDLRHGILPYHYEKYHSSELVGYHAFTRYRFVDLDALKGGNI